MPTQQHLPTERDSVTRKIQIGTLEGYAIVGLYSDGRPGELFLTFQGEGSMERGLSHALALMISIALQHGVPLEKIVDKLKGLSFEPAGLTGNSKIPMVSSVADYLARWLAQTFLSKE